MLPGSRRKIIHCWSLSAACQESMACRESIYDRLDTGRDDRTGGYGRMLGQAFSSAAEYTFFAS
jgi:hypothetical protein